MNDKLRVLVVGCGNQGTSHALAYYGIPEFELAGVVDRSDERGARLAGKVGDVAAFTDYAEALSKVKPDVVSINTWPDTHAEYAKTAFAAGAHVFMEKPVALTAEDAEAVVAAARQADRKLVIGYILRHSPSWSRFVEVARTLGKPLVMRMNLNQQSSAGAWNVHKSIMTSLSPIVDCGVHYVDLMCLMTGARPVRVSAIGARLSDDVAPGMYNYGQLQVVFDDGSVGWYEAGWGPMMSETAYFVKDIIGPRGSVSIASGAAKEGQSSDVDSHARTGCLVVHHSTLNAAGDLAKQDERIDLADEPSHQELCEREQRYLLKAIRENLDLTDHMQDAKNSLRIVLAADESVRTGKTVDL